MDVPFENDVPRMHMQRLVDKTPDISREYTITDLLHKIDPSAALDPLAEELILDIADDFIDSIVNLATESAKNRGSQSIQADDVSFVVQRVIGESSLSGRRDIPRQPDFIPNEAHLKRIRAVQEQSKQAASYHVEIKHP